MKTGLLERISLICVFAMVSTTGAEERPARLIDLSGWRLTLPVETDLPGKPDEIRQPALSTFLSPQYFFVNEAKSGIVFRAHCGGVPTKGSDYPRCELRETNAEDNERASWSTDDGRKHAMSLKVAITRTPPVKKHVVCAQIHDAKDDVIMIRLEGTKLFVERNSLDRAMLDRKYKLGTPFDIQIEAANGEIIVRYNDEEKMNWKTSKKGCYFKTGCYTQSNQNKGDAADSYGEVIIYNLKIQHAKSDSAK